MAIKDEILNKLKKEISNNKLSFTDLVSFDDLSVNDIDLIMKLAFSVSDILRWDFKKIPLLQWKTHINFFMENSTRTRTSFELAWKNLWADVINISWDASSMSKWETLLDTSITLDSMQADVITVRSPNSWVPRFISNNVKSSVINAWDWWNEHPTQSLLDLFTLQRFVWKDLKWKKMVIVWDTMHSRVFWSLARMTKKMWIKAVVSAPHTLVQVNIDQWWIKYEPDLEKALKWADIIYVLRLQTERAATWFIPTLREYSKTYIINEKRLAIANKNAVVLHPWPVIREFDLHTNVLERDICLVPEQVFSWYVVRFVLLWLLSNNRKDKEINKRIFKSNI